MTESPAPLSEVLACPACGGTLARLADAVTCGACGARYATFDGIPDFVPDDRAWTFGGQGSQQDLAERARNAGWEAAVREAYPDSAAAAWLTDTSRGRGTDFLDLDPDARVLDVGCGWGVLSLYMAERHAEVHAVDITPESLAFLGIRAAQERRGNLHLTRADLLESVPFRPASFDGIVVNGVLEWVPEYHEGPPAAVQTDFLRICAGLLKPGGRILVGIENRFGLPYFFGGPDEHTGLPWVTLLPRGMANRLSLRRRGRPFRTYTHSARALCDILRSTGLTPKKVGYPLPSYRDPACLIPRGGRRECWDYASDRLGEKLGAPFRSMARAAASVGASALFGGVLERVMPSLYLVAERETTRA